jgi:hypothetical protein
MPKNDDISWGCGEPTSDAQVNFYAGVLFLDMPGPVTPNSVWFAKIKKPVAHRPRGEMGEWLKPDASKASVP